MNIGLSDAIRHMHPGFETVTVSHSLRQIEQAAPNNDALAPRTALLAPYNGAISVTLRFRLRWLPTLAVGCPMRGSAGSA
jgi:hypothetical protein